MLSDAHTVYVDDSGTDSKARIVAAAFCVSTIDKWNEFERKWKKIREHAGFKHFHMTEFAACRRDKWCNQCKSGQTDLKDHPWRNWSPQKRKNVLNRLAKAVVNHTECGFGMAHTKAEYEQHVAKSPAGQFVEATDPVSDDHFTFAVQRCGGELAKWRAEHKISAPLKFVFDLSSQKQKEQLAKVFFAVATGRDQIVNGVEQWFAPTAIAYESRKNVVQLLAADMLAWTTAVIRSRQVFLRGEIADALQVGRIFLGTEHIRIGYTSKETFAQWERDVVSGSSATSASA